MDFCSRSSAMLNGNRRFGGVQDVRGTGKTDSVTEKDRLRRREETRMVSGKTAARLMIAAGGAAAFLGCGQISDGGEWQALSETEISGKITVWEHAITFEPAMENLIEGFEEKYPDTEVEWEIWEGDSYYELVSLAFQAGDGPDLFYTDGIARPQMREYAKAGKLLDLSDLVDFRYFDESDLWRETLDGRCYGVPWLTFDSRIVYYNADMFRKYGWEIPETFTEFENLLEEIKQAGITPISITPHDSYSLLFLWEPILTAMYPEYASGLEEESSDLLGEPAKAAMQKMLDWAEAGYFGEDWYDVASGGDQGLQFTSGEAAMNVCGTWDGVNIQANNPNLNMGVFILPSDGENTGIMGSIASGFSVNAYSDNMPAALAFADYCSSLEGQTRWISSLGGISASDQIESATENSRIIAQQANGNLYTSWQLVLASRSDEAVKVWEDGFVRLFAGEISIEELCADLEDALETTRAERKEAEKGSVGMG